MPLVWASRIAGTPLPERVAGSTLIERFSEAAARADRAVFIVGGGFPAAPCGPARPLPRAIPGSGSSAPWSLSSATRRTPSSSRRSSTKVAASGADLVLVGLGFPKQERLAETLCERLPTAWVLGCGGGIQMAAGEAKRPPVWAQRMGVEWIVRLLQEPRRLGHRYLVDDVPAALILLGQSLRRRLSGSRTALQ